ncbi:MAG TPA: tRNA (adenosine(37)-N6)-dimethylallyltransferase MiaA [Magnetospirillaceae bacterium]
MDRKRPDRKLIVIGGPTASGKSALAVSIAERFAGTVINADSMQVYDGLSILTNRPGAEDEKRAPHRLFGIIPPEEACSAGRWQTLAVAACAEAWTANRIPVVVGGTGLYLRTLIDGIAPIPDVPQPVREATRALCREIGVPAFHQKLAARDPAIAAKLRPSDSQRLMRAWEVLEATGRSLLDWQAAPREGGLAVPHFSIFVAPPRAALYAACDARFTTMIDRGALDEVRALVARNLNTDLPVMKSLGVPELAAHLAGTLSLTDAITQAQAATRQYAKRQFTWFRHQWSPDEIVNAQFSESLGNEIFTKIREFLLTGG